MKRDAINKLYLELSQFVDAKTSRELVLESLVEKLSEDLSVLRVRHHKTEARLIALKLQHDGMRCNCNLDYWEPEVLTGHNLACRIHAATIKGLSDAALKALAKRQDNGK